MVVESDNERVLGNRIEPKGTVTVGVRILHLQPRHRQITCGLGGKVIIMGDKSSASWYQSILQDNTIGVNIFAAFAAMTDRLEIQTRPFVVTSTAIGGWNRCANDGGMNKATVAIVILDLLLSTGSGNFSRSRLPKKRE